eukprot:3857109-Amphidinium_carterae.1
MTVSILVSCTRTPTGCKKAFGELVFQKHHCKTRFCWELLIQKHCKKGIGGSGSHQTRLLFYRRRTGHRSGSSVTAGSRCWWEVRE